MKKILLIIFLSLIAIPWNIFMPVCLGFENNTDQTGFQRALVASGRYQLWEEKNKTAPLGHVQGDRKEIQELQALTYLQGYEPATHLENVVYYDKRLALNGYNLLVSAHAPEALLTDMRGKILHRWHFSCESLPNFSKEYCTDYWVKASLFPNGDLLVLFPYVGLLKINKKSELLWFYKTIAHHDFDVDKKGRVFLLTMRQFKMPDGLPIINEYVTIVSPHGQKEKEISMLDLLKDHFGPSYFKKIIVPAHQEEPRYKNNGPHSLISLGDRLHSNSIEILNNASSPKSSLFKNGYLLISILRLRMLIVVDPQKEKIVQTIGPNIWGKRPA